MKNKLKQYTTIFIVFILAPAALSIVLTYVPHKEVTPTHGPPHNYWVPKEVLTLQDSLEIIDPDMMYLRKEITEEDVMILDTMLNQVEGIEKDIDSLSWRIDRIEEKIDELLFEQGVQADVIMNDIDMDCGDDFPLKTYEDSEEELIN